MKIESYELDKNILIPMLNKLSFGVSMIDICINIREQYIKEITCNYHFKTTEYCKTIGILNKEIIKCKQYILLNK